MLFFVARREQGSGGPSWGVLLLALGFACGHFGLFGFPPVPSGSQSLAGTDWLAWITMAAGILLVFGTDQRMIAVIMRWFLGGGMLALVLRAALQYQWEGVQAAGWIVGLSALGLALWWSINGLALRVEGPTVPAILLVVLTALAICCALTGSAKLGQLAGLLCAGVGALWIVRWMRPNVPFGAAEVTLLVMAAFGLGLCAHFYSELPAVDALLLCCGCFSPWLAQLPAVRGRTARQRAVMALLFALIPVAIATARTALAFETDPYSDYDY